jgi:hypothetical protein
MASEELGPTTHPPVIRSSNSARPGCSCTAWRRRYGSIQGPVLAGTSLTTFGTARTIPHGRQFKQLSTHSADAFLNAPDHPKQLSGFSGECASRFPAVAQCAQLLLPIAWNLSTATHLGLRLSDSEARSFGLLLCEASRILHTRQHGCTSWNGPPRTSER